MVFLPATDAWTRQYTGGDFTWRGMVASGATLEVKGVNGDVTAEAASSGEAEVVAVMRARRSDPRLVRVEVVQHGGGVTFCAVYPSRDADKPNQCAPGDGGRMNVQDNDVRVTFTVKVPPGVSFVGRTVNGDAVAQSLNGPVDLKTVNGSATLSTSAHGQASTVNGSIQATLGASDWAGELQFKTVNGSVTLDLPADLSADVRAATVNGDLSTDFPLTVSGRFSPRRLQGTIGAGGRTLALETVNGSIKLRRR
jgi:DUF4097 and DUF4098 domain-containing protein YvlB